MRKAGFDIFCAFYYFGSAAHYKTNVRTRKGFYVKVLIIDPEGLGGWFSGESGFFLTARRHFFLLYKRNQFFIFEVRAEIEHDRAGGGRLRLRTRRW